MEKDTPLNDWDINPEYYQKDNKGKFVLKVDGTPKKKAGRRKGVKSAGYNYHSETIAKRSARKSLLTKEKRVEKMEARLKNAKEGVRRQRKIQGKLDEPASKQTITGKIITKEDILEHLPETAREQVYKKNIIFEPNEGPQTEFLASPERDVLYGGAAGGCLLYTSDAADE